MAVETLPRYLFSIEEFYRMGRAGVFADDQRVELIEGEVVPMSPIGEEHADCVDTIAELFHARLAGRVRIRVQGPLSVGRRSALQPDVAVLRRGRYRDRHPEPDDVFLVVEVADTTLQRDRLKLPIYAAGGLREVWIVDLHARAVHVHREPSEGQYRAIVTLTAEDEIAIEALPDVVFRVGAILG